MQTVTQFNPNKNRQVISSQVLAEYFSNHDEPLELEKTSHGFVLHIPKSFFNKQANTDKNKQVDLSQFSINAFKQIKDPVTWQRQIRNEW